jgi:hypothetical protein
MVSLARYFLAALLVLALAATSPVVRYAAFIISKYQLNYSI